MFWLSSSLLQRVNDLPFEQLANGGSYAQPQRHPEKQSAPLPREITWATETYIFVGHGVGINEGGPGVSTVVVVAGGCRCRWFSQFLTISFCWCGEVGLLGVG